MSTELFGEHELDTDTDFAWDEFLPDEVEAEGTVEEEEEDSQLELDDSEFAWDAGIDAEDPETEEQARAEAARIEAAFTRMEDTVRRTFAADDEEVRVTDPTSLGTLIDPEDLEPEPELLFVDDEDDDHVVSAPQPVGHVASFVEDHDLDQAEPELLILEDSELAPPEAGAPDLDHDLVADDPAGSELWSFEEPARWGSEPDEATAAWPAPVLEPEAGPALEPALEPVLEPVGGGTPDAVLHTGLESERDAGPDGVGPGDEEPPPGRGGRSRVRQAVMALACVVVVLVAGVVVSRAVHRSAANAPAPAVHATGAAHPTTTVPSESTALAAARLQTATDEADSATTTAIAGLTSLASFPTPTNVAAVVNPYVASLLLYQAYLSGATVPPSALSATAVASDEIRNDLTFLNTINGLPPIQLGSFIKQFEQDATQLQATLGTIEHALSTTGRP